MRRNSFIFFDYEISIFLSAFLIKWKPSSFPIRTDGNATRPVLSGIHTYLNTSESRGARLMNDFRSPATITSDECIISYHTSIIISVVFLISISSGKVSHSLNHVSLILMSTQRGDETIDTGGIGNLQIFLKILPSSSLSLCHSISTSPYCSVLLTHLRGSIMNAEHTTSPSSNILTGEYSFRDTFLNKLLLLTSISIFCTVIGLSEIDAMDMDKGIFSLTGSLTKESELLPFTSYSLLLSSFVNQSFIS